jgi:RNA-binding protein YhbY
MPVIREIQLGKNGLTDNFISSLKNQFHNCSNVRISVLKSFCRDKKELEKIKDKILEALGKNYTARTIGYVIVLRKWRKAREEKESDQ